MARQSRQSREKQKGDKMTKKLLWPAEVAREVGVSPKTVNRYADAGAVEVLRDARGRRHYRPSAIETLRVRLGLQGDSLGAAHSEE